MPRWRKSLRDSTEWSRCGSSKPWRDHRLVVETDSFTYYRGSVAFENDSARDLDLRSRGFIVLRFSERQIDDEPDHVVADVARALSVSPSPGNASARY